MKMASFLLLSTILVTGCASKKQMKKEIEQEAAQSNVKDPKALSGTIHNLIDSSKTLTDAQKKELTNIVEMNKKKATELSEKSYEYRAVLIQELLSEKMNKKKIKLIKKDIKKIEAERLKNTFDTVEKISSIVSKNADKTQYAEHLMMMDRPIR